MRMSDEEIDKAINESPSLILEMERNINELDTENEKLLSLLIVDFGKKIIEMAIEIQELRSENERLRERVKAAEYVLKQARPESGYWDAYAKEALK